MSSFLICAELASEFGHKDRVDYEQELQSKQLELQILIDQQRGKKRADKRGRHLRKAAREAC